MPDIKNEIISTYKKFSIVFGNESHSFPFEFFTWDDCGGYHVEYDKSGKLSLVGTERGHETVRKDTYDLDELMYWIFKGAAFSRGQQYELQHRHPTNDPRRTWFPKALEEIGKISLSWQKRMAYEQQEILSKHPFFDRE